MFGWLEENWFALVQTIGITAGLAYTGGSLFRDSRIRALQYRLELTKQHREIWMNTLSSPKLLRVLEPAPDLKKTPVTAEEQVFINLVIQHVSTIVQANQYKVVGLPDGVRGDIRAFFSLPIPHAVWLVTKCFRDQDVVEYLDGLLNPG